MTAQEAKQRLERIWRDYTSAYDTVSIEDLMAFDMATNALGAIDQIQWERDMAIKQLHDLGYGLGEKPREDNSSSDKLIKASDAVDVVAKHSALYGNGEVSTDEGETLLYDIMSEIMNLSSAQTEIIYCKDCVCGHCEEWLCGNGSTDVYGYCGRTNFRVLPYDYCSRAERKEDE